MYNRKKSEQMLIDTYGFKSTGEKHEENIFTRWYQSFYLFEKWGIDKRKAYYSSLINSGQLDRKTAMQLLLEPPIYPFLGIESKVLKYPKRFHEEFKKDLLFPLISDIIRSIRSIYRYAKRILKRE